MCKKSKCLEAAGLVVWITIDPQMLVTGIARGIEAETI
jgi:hypothetical protein